MTGFEPWTSGIGSNCSTNWATTTAVLNSLLLLLSISFSICTNDDRTSWNNYGSKEKEMLNINNNCSTHFPFYLKNISLSNSVILAIWVEAWKWNEETAKEWLKPKKIISVFHFAGVLSNHSDLDNDNDENPSSDDLELRSVGSSPNEPTSRTLTDPSSPPSILSSSIQGSSPGMNGGSPNSISSIQAALAALKAGQMSLNQVIVFIYKKTLFFRYCQTCTIQSLFLILFW